jgi:hypothetical protein
MVVFIEVNFVQALRQKRVGSKNSPPLFIEPDGVFGVNIWPEKPLSRQLNLIPLPT